jgi:hypothetical protein
MVMTILFVSVGCDYCVIQEAILTNDNKNTSTMKNNSQWLLLIFFVEHLPLWGYIDDAADEDMVVGETEGSKYQLIPAMIWNTWYAMDPRNVARP